MLNPQSCQRVFYISHTQSLRLLRTARLEKSDQVGNARPTFFMRFFLHRWARLRRSSGHPYLRAQASLHSFGRSVCRAASGSWTKSPVLRGSGVFSFQARPPASAKQWWFRCSGSTANQLELLCRNPGQAGREASPVTY